MTSTFEPSDLDWAITARVMMGHPAIGPLTSAQQDEVDAYEAYQEESALEYEAQQAAGGRTICPQCGNRSVKHRAVCTLGYPGHPGAEFSDFASCERCDYMEV